MYKHYIRINSDNYVVHSFTDGFETPLETDICIEEGDRCWSLQTMDMDGIYQYKYADGVLSKITDEEKKASSGYIEMLRAKKIDLCKSMAMNNIYAEYPAYKQTNMTKESYKQSIIIAASLGKSIEVINAAMYPMILAVTTLEEAKTLRDSISTIDLASLVSSVSAASQPPIILAYRKVLASLVADKLIDLVRDWCAEKENEINKCITSDQLDAISFADCPVITK